MGLPKKLGMRQLRILSRVAKKSASFFELKGTEKRNLNRDIKKLEEKGLITLGGDRIKLSDQGKKLLEQIELQEVDILKPKKWDGIWHVVAYDIPNDFKKERDYFRRKLKNLDFVQLQESMWIYPYPCKEEIAIVTKFLSINPFVIYLTTEKIPNNNKYKKHYNLK